MINPNHNRRHDFKKEIRFRKYLSLAGFGCQKGIHLIPHCIKTSRGLNPCLPNKAWSCMPWSYACQCRVSGWWRHLQACKCEERDLWCVLLFCRFSVDIWFDITGNIDLLIDLFWEIISRYSVLCWVLAFSWSGPGNISFIFHNFAKVAIHSKKNYKDSTHPPNGMTERSSCHFKWRFIFWKLSNEMR
jgi:hypothetical protein